MRKIITQHNNLLSRAASKISVESDGGDINAGRDSFPGLNEPVISRLVIYQSSVRV